ncbi:hypothetical protein EV1_035831 [Malus domestica]
MFPDCLKSTGGIVPFNMLVLRSNHIKLLQSPSSGGILPKNELLLSLSIARFGSFPIHPGTSPLNLLFANEIQFKLVQLLRPMGIDPVSSLKSRMRFSSDPRYISSCGISPLGWFNQMIKSRSLDNDPKIEGMVPLR